MDETKLIKGILAMVLGGLFVFLGLMTLFKGFYIVDPGHTALHQRLGKIISIRKEPGFYSSIPYVDTITHMNTKICLEGTETTALSKDLQFVSIGVALNYRIIDVESVYKNIGTHFREKIIDPFAAESIKAVIAQYTAEDLIHLRHEAKDKVREDLSERLGIHNIELVEFNFVHVDFSKAFLHSVEEKQIAQQNALMAKNETGRIQELALQKRIKADADGYAERVKSDALAYGLNARKSSVTKELIEIMKVEKWDGVLPKVTSGSNMIKLDI